VFVGAPYAGDLALRSASVLGNSALLSPGATVVVEVFRKTEPASCYGVLKLDSVRQYGETRLLFYRFVKDAHTD